MSARIMTEAEERQLQDFIVEAARLISDLHCEDVRLMDVRDLSQVCNFILLGSGTSDRQMKSVASELEDLGKAHDQSCFRTSRDTATTWIVIDFVDLVAHLFEPGQRAFYDLESLWSDAPTVSWRRPDDERGRNDGSAAAPAGEPDRADRS